MKTKENFLTFSTKGLNAIQVKFLSNIENLYFEGVEINRDLMYKAALEHKGKPAAKKIIEAFDYWEFMPKPFIRESLKTPVKLSELLIKGGNKYLTDTTTRDSWKVAETDRMRALNLQMLDGLSTYYEIINGNLHIKYDQILGGRFIAAIKNDLL